MWKQNAPVLSKFKVDSVKLWSDSQVTLYWLEREPASLSTFAANRVAEIQERSNHVIWRHVPTELNPADVASRGACGDELMKSLWFKGQSFLTESAENWPQFHKFELCAEVQSSENKKCVSVHKVVHDLAELNRILELIIRRSSFSKVIRIVACHEVLLQKLSTQFLCSVGH